MSQFGRLDVLTKEALAAATAFSRGYIVPTEVGDVAVTRHPTLDGVWRAWDGDPASQVFTGESAEEALHDWLWHNLPEFK